jgi:AraC-like DNA-binding protein
MNDGNAASEINIWDSEYVPDHEAFSFYREALSSVFMPWSAEIAPHSEFKARIEALAIGQSLVSKVRLKAPLEVSRSKREIADSQLDCFYACFVLSGALQVEQSGRSNIANPGDLAIFDSAVPVELTSYGGYTDLTLMIPKCKMFAIKNVEDYFNNRVFSSGQLISPLSSCLNVLAGSMPSSSTTVLASLFNASISLLEVQAESVGGVEGVISQRPNYLVREIQKFVEQNIDNGRLSPQDAATHAGVSVRYVHKLFAAHGTTFNSDLMVRRLDLVCRDLVSPSCRGETISAVAFRWGFNDLSTFTRAFRRRFGCSPRSYRSDKVS